METVTESTSGACPQPTSQLSSSLNGQSSTNNSVKGSQHILWIFILYWSDHYREVFTQ